MLTREDLLGGSGATGVVGGVTNDGDSGVVGEVGSGDITGFGVFGTGGSGIMSWIICTGRYCCTTGSGSIGLWYSGCTTGSGT